MSGSLSDVFVGNKSPKAIVNGYSTNGVNPSYWIVSMAYGMAYCGCKQVLCGATTANTLKTVLSITGAGCIDLLALTAEDATSRTLRAKLTIDGSVVFDSTSAANTTAFAGLGVVGCALFISSTVAGGTPDPTFFNKSLLLEVASSLTETDKMAISYRYKTF